MGQDIPRRAAEQGCIFCDVNDKDFRLEYKDDEIAIFHDIAPAACWHLLAIPLQHIGTIKDLRPGDAAMVQRLGTQSLAIVKQKLGVDPQSVRLGFHVPPFNSVYHLHLHILVEPIKMSRRYKYASGVWWFRSLDEQLAMLRSG
ncbi:hypothetical protein RI367_008354 [Sorochytrium milnesiophthora]